MRKLPAAPRGRRAMVVIRHVDPSMGGAVIEQKYWVGP